MTGRSRSMADEPSRSAQQAVALNYCQTYIKKYGAPQNFGPCAGRTFWTTVGPALNKNKGKNKPVKTTTFKKKKKLDKADLDYYVCGKPGHFFKECLEHAGR